ncbi:M3 family oligoendopeptidase [Olivibacter sp. SDN3]|uniref:M3 family oligoendopeptidase n=1 Tax=Olivibacter sp. SDN3 TaxID=2764720 RepID=UPI001650DBC8|nr:M3 family oligoendopeptidase [Olivibacter sp. SDN3]QNL50012.1 M3 family oligoendopeptidase [Olivibacter sp. SDN3]
MLTNKKRQYVPVNLQITWDNLSPLFKELEDRPIRSKEELEKWMLDRSELEAVLEEDFAWRYIRMTCDTTDETLLKNFQYFASEIEPKIAPISNSLNKKLIDSKYRENLDQEKYFTYLRSVKKALEIFRQENVALQTEIQLKQQKYQSITGNMEVEIIGQKYTLPQAASFLKDPDRIKRANVWRKITDRRLQDKVALQSLFSDLLKLRHQIAVNAGFENYRDYMFQAMGRFDYNPQDCYAFHAAIEKEVVPLLQERAKIRQERLKTDRLKPWDLEVDTTGKPALKPFDSGKELIDKTVQCFSKLDPYVGKCIETMRDNNLFDVESRKGKAPGGYNYPLAERGAPFIFMNAAGTFRDLTTMVHEGGHALHTFLSAHLELNDFKHLTSEIAELASMSMELISMDHWDLFFDNPDDLKRAKKEQLEDILKTLPWVAIVDQFQHWLYTNPDHTEKQRNQAWNQLFNQFGENFADWTGEEEAKAYLWQKQLHIYEVPFYYIEYGMAQLGAIAIWRNYKENREKGLKQYMEALKLGYTKTIPEIYETAGIEFNFSQAYVKELIDFTKQELEAIR